MLESIRNASQGVVGKAIMTIVMGLIIVSFVIWGVGDMLRGFSPSTVASVGGAKISAQDYRIAYDRAIQQYQRRLRRPFTNEEARQIGLDRSVLQQLLNEAAVDDEARKLGLGISDEALREVITSNPNFRDKSGAFDPTRLAGALRDMDMNERGFVSELRKQVLEAVHRRRAGDRDHRAQGRGHGGSRLSGSDPVGGLFPPARFGGGRDCRAVGRGARRPSTTIASRAIARPNTGR